MVFHSSLSASSLLSAHIRQDIAIVFVAPERLKYSFKDIKKYIYTMVALLGFCGFLPSSGYAATVGETRDFIVTAYYSPLPDQSFYFKWNYDAEIKLNGNGESWASGQKVFAGMIAAPKSYDFGTKIYFDGLWIGTVADRGGAIVIAWDRGQPYDRIDIWMGSGETWLKRALIWWRRKVTWVIVESSASGSPIDFKSIDSGKIDLARFEKVTTITNGILPEYVLAMFADLGYTPDGWMTKDMIIDFQIDHAIVSKNSDPGAGNYGPLTQAKLKEEYAHYRALKDAEIQRIEAERTELINNHTEWEDLSSRAESRVETFWNPKRGDHGGHVRELQSFLRTTGYFKWQDTGVMTPSTILALKSLQRKNGLIPTGKIDTKTREALVEVLIQQKLV